MKVPGVIENIRENKISVIAPINYLNGAIMFSLQYTIDPKAGYCNKVGSVIMTPIYQKQMVISESAEMHPDKKITDQFDVEVVKHAARIGAELGADIIKTNYTGTPDSFREVVKGCPVPVVMAGGPKTKTNEEFCKMVYDSIQAGGAGIAAGRNVFQHENPTKMVKVLCSIVHEDLNFEKALKRYIK